MKPQINIVLNPKEENKSKKSLEPIIKERNEFPYLEKLIDFFHHSKQNKEEIYLEIVNFTLDCYSYHLRKGENKFNAKISSLYKTGIREIDYQSLELQKTKQTF